MWKNKIFWFVLAGIFGVSALFFLPYAPIRFGGYFLGSLAVGCLGEGICIAFAAKARWIARLAQVGRLLFALFCVSFVWIQILILQGSHTDPEAEQAEYVLVLGAHILPTRPSDSLIERLNTTADFLKTHPNATAILCGGQGTNEPMPESHMMRDYLIEVHQIPAERLLVEDTSRNTIQNIDNAKALYDLEQYRCAVVSSEFHLARARKLMARAGLDPYAIAAPTPNFPLLLASHMREYASTLGLILTGRYF